MRKKIDRRRLVFIPLFFVVLVATLIPYMHFIGACAVDYAVTDNILFIEDSARAAGWTDSLKADYEEEVGYQKEMQESEDFIIRFVATNPWYVVIIPLVFVGVLLGFLGYLLVKLLKAEYHYLKGRR